MNMHVVAAARPAAPIQKTIPPRTVGDRDLIDACNRAKALFKKERCAEQRVFDAEDRNAPRGRFAATARRAVIALQYAVAEIADIQARTPEGLAYKAAMLAPWIAAGMTLDDDSPGRDLALSIAKDACIIGMQDVAYRPSKSGR